MSYPYRTDEYDDSQDAIGRAERREARDDFTAAELHAFIPRALGIPAPSQVTIRPGDRMIWRHVVSNYGHIARTPVEVMSVGPKRVRVAFAYDGMLRIRSVKPENLLPLDEKAGGA